MDIETVEGSDTHAMVAEMRRRRDMGDRVFTSTDFPGINAASVRSNMRRLAATGRLRRVGHGLYDIETSGPMPSMEECLRAFSRKIGAIVHRHEDGSHGADAQIRRLTILGEFVEIRPCRCMAGIPVDAEAPQGQDGPHEDDTHIDNETQDHPARVRRLHLA